MPRNVSLFSDHGLAKYPEDEIIRGYSKKSALFGVLDGVSIFYHPRDGPRLFGGLTSGQMVVRCIKETVSPDLDLTANIEKACRNLGKLAESHYPLQPVYLRPGASFAFMQTRKDSEDIEIVQGGDCLALIADRKGFFLSITPNQVYGHDLRQFECMEETESLYGRDNDLIWTNLIKINQKLNKKDVNMPSKNGFALLNGDPNVIRFMNKITVKASQVGVILLFTDGFVPFELTSPERIGDLGRSILSLYRKGGLEAAFKWSKEHRKRTFASIPEAAAIAIEL